MKIRVTLLKPVRFLLIQRTVALELFLCLIAFFFSIFFLTTPVHDLQRSLIVGHMLVLFPAKIWGGLLLLKAIFGIVGNATGSLRLRRYGAMIQMFVWGMVSYFVFKYVPFPNYTHGIYASLFIGGVWSYLSIQNETRLFKQGQQMMTVSVPRELLQIQEVKSKL